MMKERRSWMSDVSKSIQRIKDRNLRGIIEETWTRMRYKNGGEMAMLGCFQPRWVDTIYKGRMELRDGEDRTVMRIFKMIGEGARRMIKLYNDIKEGGQIGKELRQTNMRGFYGRKGRGIDTPYIVEREKNKNRKINGVDFISFKNIQVIYFLCKNSILWHPNVCVWMDGGA